MLLDVVHTSIALMTTVLRHILLLQKDVLKAAEFYQQGLGLPVTVLTEKWAELRAGSSTIALKAVEGYGSLGCL